MKKIFIICCIIFLGSCSNKAQTAGECTLNTAKETTAQSESIETAAKTEQVLERPAIDDSDIFSGSYFTVDGKPLIIPPKNERKSFDELSMAENFDMETGIYGDYYLVNGTAYIRKATGISDPNCANIEVEWREVNKEEKTGSLTVKEASTLYWYFPAVDEFYWNTMDIEFSGEVTMKGVIFSYINDLDSSKGYFYGDGFYFVPFPSSLEENDFPMMCDTQMTKGKVSPMDFSFDDGYSVCGDSVSIKLKNLPDDMKERLVNELNEFDYFTAEVTLKDPCVSVWCEDGIPYFKAECSEAAALQ